MNVAFDVIGYLGIFCVPQFLTAASGWKIAHVRYHTDYVADRVGIDHVSNSNAPSGLLR